VFGRELVQKVCCFFVSYYIHYSNISIYLQSWAHCQVKGWDLSAECLTSRQAQTALVNYLHTHSALHEEIKDRMGIIHRLDEIGSVEDNRHASDSELDHITADADDDADVRSSVVIHDALGLVDMAEIPAEVDSVSLCVTSTEKGPSNLLVAAGEYANIWAFINFDECL
jgi:hypothetical protein